MSTEFVKKDLDLISVFSVSEFINYDLFLSYDDLPVNEKIMASHQHDRESFDEFHHLEDHLTLSLLACAIYDYGTYRIQKKITKLESTISNFSWADKIFMSSLYNLKTSQLDEAKNNLKSLSKDQILSRLKVKNSDKIKMTIPYLPKNTVFFLLKVEGFKITVKPCPITDLSVYGDDDSIHTVTYRTDENVFEIDKNFEEDLPYIRTSTSNHTLYYNEKDAIIAKNKLIDEFNQINKIGVV
jgi:hypothetical protein